MEVVQNPIKAANQKSFEERKEELEKQKKEEEEQKKRERQSPFKSFYQVNKANSEHLRICLKENPKALELLLFLFEKMDNYNAVMCSYKVFEEVLGVSRQTASKAVAYLKEKGFVYIYKSGTSNVYVANNNLVWNSWGTNMKYCQFPANVVLSSSEQEEQDKRMGKRYKTIRITTIENLEKENEESEKIENEQQGE